MLTRVLDGYLTLLVIIVVGLCLIGLVAGIIGGLWSSHKLAPTRRLQDDDMRAALAQRDARRAAAAAALDNTKE